MNKSYTAENIIYNSRFINIWSAGSELFKQWTSRRVQELIDENPEYCTKVTFTHMRNLFTAIAIHEWDINHGMSKADSIERLGKAMEEYMLPSKKKIQKLLSKAVIFKVIGPMVPKLMTSANGKGFFTTPVKVKGGFGFDTTQCPFNNIMSQYGHPDLGKRFCQIDEYMYGQIPNVRFERSGTLCRGCTKCDFRFYWDKCR